MKLKIAKFMLEKSNDVGIKLGVDRNEDSVVMAIKYSKDKIHKDTFTFAEIEDLIGQFNILIRASFIKDKQ